MTYISWYTIKFNQPTNHFKWQATEIRKPVHIPWQQYLIYWKWCQHMPSKGMDNYWQVVNLMEIWSLW